MLKQNKVVIISLFLLVATNAKAATNEQPQAVLVSGEKTANLTLVVDQYSEPLSEKALDEMANKNNSFSLSSNYRSEFENIHFCPTNKIFCQLTLTKNKMLGLRLSPQISLNDEAIRANIEDLARKVNRDPIEAKFKIENGKVATFSEAQDGLTLDSEKSIAILKEFLLKNELQSEQKISLPFDVKKVSGNYGDVNNLGISSLIGKGVSDFKGSPKNRVLNIKVAIQRFNGVLIEPGEEFSFVKTLGDVDKEHGYFPELVIKKGITEPEFGGGVCQVSTTAFRAAINSGLKITARRNHAYPVSYYSPQGMDSTVYVPNPDLKFLNNTPNHILIQTEIVGSVLTFNFYGTDDGRKTVIDGPHVTEKQPDGALKTTFTQTVFDKNGNELINDIFNSSYASPYKYPHPGGPTLSAKPSNWSEEEWKAYKKTLRDMERALVKAKG